MAIQPFRTLTAICALLPNDNINTDDIYPGPSANPIAWFRELMLSQRTLPKNLAINAFAVWRWHADGSPRAEFILNQPPFDTAQILIAGDNFGCGSSREGAVWSLMAIGIRCIIAPSFGDIFYNNCFKNGILPIRLQPAAMALLLNAVNKNHPQLTIDLENQIVETRDGAVTHFNVDSYKRHCLLNGLDEIGATLEKLPLIEQGEAKYFQRRPWLA